MTTYTGNVLLVVAAVLCGLALILCAVYFYFSRMKITSKRPFESRHRPSQAHARLPLPTSHANAVDDVTRRHQTKPFGGKHGFKSGRIATIDVMAVSEDSPVPSQENCRPMELRCGRNSRISDSSGNTTQSKGKMKTGIAIRAIYI